MPKAIANNIEIEYDTFGKTEDEPIILINGLGSQMIRWIEGFCEALVKKGFYVIRFDNRDVGLSSKIDSADEQNIMEVINAIQKGKSINLPYTLNDMADDAIGLLDYLKLKKAHICGVSMGGMIAQIIAYRHSSRVLSLVSIMSSTGDSNGPQATPQMMQMLMTPAPKERDANINHSVEIRRILNGSGFAFDGELHKQLAEEAYDRSYYPDGYNRQMLAIISSDSRKTNLKSIKVPTLVIHGSVDPLVPVDAGKDTANSIPDAELIIIEGMGHSFPFPRETWPKLVDAISKNAKKALGTF